MVPDDRKYPGKVVKNSPSENLTLLLLLKLACCGIPLLLVLAAGGLGTATGFVTENAILLLAGFGLVMGGYLWWRRKKQKGCCPEEKDEID